MLKNNNDKLNDEEKQLKEILRQLNIIPATKDNAELMEEDIDKAKIFVRKIQKGSAAVLQNDQLENDRFLVLEANDDENILLNTTINNVESEVLEESKKILYLASDVDVKAPIGELDFSIDTQGQDYSIINMKLPSGIDIDSLIKTTADGTPYQFNTTELSYEGNREDIDSWISELNYNIYDYSSKFNKQDILFELSADSSLKSEMQKSGLDLGKISDIDGSAYLIDTDGDKIPNIMSMILLDQGWFDTRKDAIGLIGDPLTPVQLRTVVNIVEKIDQLQQDQSKEQLDNISNNYSDEYTPRSINSNPQIDKSNIDSISMAMSDTYLEYNSSKPVNTKALENSIGKYDREISSGNNGIYQRANDILNSLLLNQSRANIKNLIGGSIDYIVDNYTETKWQSTNYITGGNGSRAICK